MKRLSLVVVAGALATAPFAHAADPFFSKEGEAQIANPASKVTGGVTETVNPCNTDDPDLGNHQGLDGFWIELPEGAGDRAATLDSDAVDMDVWFYEGSGAGCELLDDEDDENAFSMSTDLTADEEGVIPVAATWAIVDLAVGADAAFTFAIH